MAKPLSKLISLITPKRRWAQFGVGTMLLAVTALCILLADYVSPIRRLERQLRDPDEEVRLIAAERLGYLGPEARSTTKSLLRATDDESQEVCVKAVWALSRVSGRADLLAPLLTHDDDEIRLAAVEGMLWTGDDRTELVPMLLEMDPVGRADVGAIFEALGPAQAAIAVPILLDSLSPADGAAQRDPAAATLSRVGAPAATVVPALIDRLSREQPHVRKAAAEQLLRLGQLAKEAAPALRARLHDPDLAFAAACAAALGAVDPNDDEFLAVLRRALRADDRRLGHQVNWYLWALGPDAAEAADDVVAYLCDARRDDAWPRAEAATFMRLGPPAVLALDRALKQALADRDRPPATVEEFQERLKNMAWVALPVLQRALELVRGAHDAARVADDTLPARLRLWMVRILEEAIALAAPHRRSMTPMYLGMIGPPASSSVPTLIAALDCADFRDSALFALARIGKDTVGHLLPLLDRVDFRDSALFALASIGKDALKQFLDSNDRSLRDLAREALAEIGVSDEAVRARLRPSLTSGDLGERIRAARLLAALGEPVEQILPTLFELALDPRLTRAALLTNIVSLGAAAVPDLAVALESRNPRMRQLAVEALGKIGPPARDAVPRLIELLDDADLWDTATEALGRIGPDAHAAVPKLLEALAARRVPPNRGDYDPDDYEPSRYEYLLRLHALGGIGAEARDAASEVLRLADFDDSRIRHTAVSTLARIDPANPSLIPLLRSWLREWERKPATEDAYEYQGQSGPHRSYAEFVDAVWELGPKAERLAPDLKRVVTTAPLVGCKARCYAACALARFAPHRREAERYLDSVVRSGFPGSMNRINLANTLLQRINGVQTEWASIVTIGIGHIPMGP